MFNVCKGSIRRKIYLLPKFEKHLPDYNRVPLPYKTYLCDETLKHMAFFCQHLLRCMKFRMFAATVLGIVHVLGVLRAGSVQRGQAVTTSVTGALVLGAGGLPSTIRIKSDRQCARTFHDICLKNP